MASDLLPKIMNNPTLEVEKEGFLRLPRELRDITYDLYALIEDRLHLRIV